MGFRDPGTATVPAVGGHAGDTVLSQAAVPGETPHVGADAAVTSLPLAVAALLFRPDG